MFMNMTSSVQSLFFTLVLFGHYSMVIKRYTASEVTILCALNLRSSIFNFIFYDESNTSDSSAGNSYFYEED